MFIPLHFFILTISSIIFPCYFYVTTLQKSILNLEAKILFLESQILIKEQEKILIDPQISNLMSYLNDPMTMKLVLGCVITLFLCGTSYYFISSTIAGTTAFITGVENTCNFFLGTPDPICIVFEMETGFVIRVIKENGIYLLQYLDVNGSEFRPIETFLKIHNQLAHAVKANADAAMTDPVTIAGQANLELLFKLATGTL